MTLILLQRMYLSSLYRVYMQLGKLHRIWILHMGFIIFYQDNKMSWTKGWIAMESKIENLSILVTHSFEKLSNVLLHLFCYIEELYLGLQTRLDRLNLMQWSLQIVMLHLFFYSGELYLGLQTWLDWLDLMQRNMQIVRPKYRRQSKVNRN